MWSFYDCARGHISAYDAVRADLGTIADMYWSNHDCARINRNVATDSGRPVVSTPPLSEGNILKKHATVADHCFRMHYQAVSMHNNQARADRRAGRDVHTEGDPVYRRNHHGHHRMSTPMKRIGDTVQTYRMPLKRTETND